MKNVEDTEAAFGSERKNESEGREAPKDVSHTRREPASSGNEKSGEEEGEESTFERVLPGPGGDELNPINHHSSPSEVS